MRHVTGVLVLQEGLPLKEVERRIGVAVASAGLHHRVVAFYLPDIDTEFREGRLCWSKVRELVKVAVAQHDAGRRREVAQCATCAIEPGAARKLAEVSRQSRNGNPLGVWRPNGDDARCRCR